MSAISYIHEQPGGSSIKLAVPSHDADFLRDQCLAAGIDVDWWYPLANTIKMVAGRESNEAFILLQKRFIVGDDNLGIPAINPTNYDHRIDIDDAINSPTPVAEPITLRGWVLHSYRAVVGNEQESDPNAIYIVKFVDLRFLFDRQPCITSISGAALSVTRTSWNLVSNTRDASGMSYDPSDTTEFPYELETTAGSDLPWTWSQVLTHLWAASSFLDNSGVAMGLTEQTLPTGGAYPEQNPIDVRPNRLGTWETFCEVLHASGNEIYPSLNGQFRILPIDDAFGDDSLLATYSSYLIETGHVLAEDRRLPNHVTMTFIIRDRDPNSETTNSSKYYSQFQPFSVGPSVPSPYGAALLTAPEVLTGKFTFASGTYEVGDFIPGVIEDHLCFAMSAVFDGALRNKDHLEDYAREVFTRLMKSRANSIDATYGRFLPLQPNPEFEEVRWSLDSSLGPITHFRSLPSRVGCDAVSEIGGGGASGKDRLVAADTTDDVPGTLYDKLTNHGTYDSMTDLLIKAEVVTVGIDPGNNNTVRLFVTGVGGTPGPPGADGSDGTDGTDGADGDTVDEGYGIDVAHAGTVATVSIDPTEWTGYAAEFQFFHHIATDTTALQPAFKTVNDYVAGDDQFWWHQSGGTFKFQTTTNYSTAGGLKQLFGHNGTQWTWDTVENWLKFVDGYTFANNQILGHTANGAIQWKNLASTTINNPGAINLDIVSTNLKSQLDVTPVTFLVWPAASAGAGTNFSDQVGLTPCG